MSTDLSEAAGHKIWQDTFPVSSRMFSFSVGKLSSELSSVGVSDVWEIFLSGTVVKPLSRPPLFDDVISLFASKWVIIYFNK